MVNDHDFALNTVKAMTPDFNIVSYYIHVLLDDTHPSKRM